MWGFTNINTTPKITYILVNIWIIKYIKKITKSVDKYFNTYK
jgi:hypothetical protein